LLDNISEKFINWLIKIKILKQEQYSDWDYWFRIFLFNSIVVFSLLTINILLGSWIQLIIISIVVNVLRMYSGGFHAPQGKLEYCVLLTIPLVTIASFIAKYLQLYPLQLFMVAVFLGILIIRKIPLISEEEKENKSDKYFRDKYIYNFLIFYSISCLAIMIDSNICNIISSAISMGIILVALAMKSSTK